MKNLTHLATHLTTPGILLLCLPKAGAVDRTKNSSTTANINTTAAWTGAVVPGPADVGVWSSTSAGPTTAGSLPPQNGDMDVSGFRIANVGGVQDDQTMVGFRNASSANTVTLGAGGINMSSALQAFQIQSKIAISADQPWNVTQANSHSNTMGFNNNEDLGFNSQLANAAFNFGGHKVTTTGTGYITITSGYTLSNGTLDVGNNLTVIQSGGSRVTTLEPTMNLVVSSNRLRFQSNTGAGGAAVNSSAPITVNGGSMQFRVGHASNTITQSGPITLAGGGLDFLIFNSTAGPLTLSGALNVNADATWTVLNDGTTAGTGPVLGGVVSGNLTGTGKLTYRNTGVTSGAYARLTGDNSAFAGTLKLDGASGNRSLMLASATAGSAAAKWEVGAGNVLQVDGLNLQLGTLNGSGTVTNSSASAPALITVGSGMFSGAITDNLAPQTMGLNKVGPGTLILTGPSSYTGPTTVTAGLLRTTSAQTGASSVSIADNATFSAAPQDLVSSFVATSLTVGSATGGTLEVFMDELANPVGAPVAVTDLTINGASKLRLSGTNLSPGTFDLVQYTNATGLAGLSLILPPRTTGVMGDSGTAVTVTINTVEQIKWNGNVSTEWDIDPDGSGSTGTPNWLTTSGNVATRYIENPNGADVVNFDDTSTGTGNERSVNLTTSLTPALVKVANNILNYTFTGSGSLTGLTSIVKTGSGTLTLANSTPYTHSAGTFIQEGALRLGDGITPGVGAIAESVRIEAGARLVLNRPDDFTFTTPVTGPGTLEKAQGNTVTLPAETTINVPIQLSGGKLLVSTGPVTLGGALSGTGLLEAGANLTLSGSEASTNTGMTTVTAGTLTLNKSANVAAVGGDITVSGTGSLTFSADEQIPDTSTVTFTGTTDDGTFGTGKETIANLVLSGAATGTQVIVRNGFTVTGTATINQGFLSVASGHSATLHGVALTSSTAFLRVGGNTAASTLNIGAGGITASAGAVQVKYNTAAFDGVLNLGGDVTTSGSFSFTNGSAPASAQNVINLSGARTFTIGDGTTTTVAPDIGGDGSLIKAGGGLLTLNSTSVAAHTGGTTVSGGELRVTGTLGGAVQVNAGTILSGSGTLTGATAVAGTVSPGTTGSGSLDSTGTVTLGPDAIYAVGVSSWTGTTAGTSWDLITAGTLNIAATPADPLVIRITGTPTGFTDTGKVLRIASSNDNPIPDFDLATIQIDATGFTGPGTWSIRKTTVLTGEVFDRDDLELVYTPAATPFQLWAAAKGLVDANDDPAFDADSDDETNLTEFALDGNPLSGAASGKVVAKVATLGTDKVLTLTLPVRNGASFTGATDKTATVDGAVYRIQAGTTLASWPSVVSEVPEPDATALRAGLPALSSGWGYRSFRAPGNLSTDPSAFIRVKITAP